MTARRQAKRQRTPSPKLNLLPPYVRAAKQTVTAIVASIVICVALVLGLGFWWQRNSTVISALREDLNKKTQLADAVIGLENEASQLRSGVSNLTQRLQILDDIRQSGKAWAEPIRQIVNWIPPYIRLTSLELQGAPTNAGVVVLVGYAPSLQRLTDFYSRLSESALFTNVNLEQFEWRGITRIGVGLPPVLPKPLAPPTEAGTVPSPVGPAPVGEMPTTPTPSGAPTTPSEAQMPGAPEEMLGEEATGMPGTGAAGTGMPGMGMPGMGMPGMGMPTLVGRSQVQIIRDPNAPRNAVYFVIRAQLVKPIQVAASLRPAQPAAAGAGGMPMMGMPMMGMPMMGASVPGGMPGGMGMQGPGGMMGGGMGGGPEGEEAVGTTPAGTGEVGGGLAGRRRTLGGGAIDE